MSFYHCAIESVIEGHTLNGTMIEGHYSLNCAIESVITYCISTWYASSSAADKNALQGCDQFGTKNHCLSSAFLKITLHCTNILKDPFHLGHHLFELLPSGKRFRSIKSQTNRLNFFLPQRYTRGRNHGIDIGGGGGGGGKCEPSPRYFF